MQTEKQSEETTNNSTGWASLEEIGKAIGIEDDLSQRTEVEQEFLDFVDEVEGFHRRADGKIEREVDGYETGIKTIKGDCYSHVEIVSEEVFLLYVMELITDEEYRRVEYKDEERRHQEEQKQE